MLQPLKSRLGFHKQQQHKTDKATHQTIVLSHVSRRSVGRSAVNVCVALLWHVNRKERHEKKNEICALVSAFITRAPPSGLLIYPCFCVVVFICLARLLLVTTFALALLLFPTSTVSRLICSAAAIIFILTFFGELTGFPCLCLLLKRASSFSFVSNQSVCVPSSRSTHAFTHTPTSDPHSPSPFHPLLHLLPRTRFGARLLACLLVYSLSPSVV